MSSAPRILLACPVSSVKDYIIWEWLEAVHWLRGDFDILLVDNSPTTALYRQLQTHYWVHRIPTRGKHTRQLLADSWNVIRDVVLHEGYDYHFMLECDIFPPTDVLPRLLAHARLRNLPVVAAPYLIFKGDRTAPMLGDMWIDPWQGSLSLEIYPPRYGAHLIDGRLQRVVAFGQGCVLAHRSIYERGIRYRYEEGKDGHADIYLATDLYTSGIPAYVDTTLFSTHRNQRWSFLAQDIK